MYGRNLLYINFVNIFFDIDVLKLMLKLFFIYSQHKIVIKFVLWHVIGFVAWMMCEQASVS